MCLINPRVDFAFKKLFGSAENKDLLISLINSIVSEEDKVADLHLKNPYNLVEYRKGKLSILDIKAQSVRGPWFNVEMQISEDYNFDKRAIYYWARLVTDQLCEGMMFKDLEKTISINILDFNFIHDRAEFHNLYKIINAATGKDDKLHDIFELHYVELRKFRKGYADLVSALDRWTAFLTRAHEIDKEHIPKELENDAAIVKAISAMDQMFDEEERIVYQVRLKAMTDVYSKIASALDKGREEGRAKGMEEGRAKGMEEGRIQALNDAVARLTESGFDQAQIRQLLGI